MASKDRTASYVVDLLQSLKERPFAYGFYSVMRKLECLRGEKPRLGESFHPSDDAVRLGQDPHLEFAPSTLSSCDLGGSGRAPRIGSYFFGLFGPNGPLPLHLTEYARNRLRSANDPTFSRFADVFHHRMIGLFYRAWAKSQPTISFDRPESDRFANYIGSLFGLGMPSLRNRDTMPDIAKLHFAGLLACQRHNPDGLKSILEAFFTMSVGIVEFVGDWMILPKESRWRLGESPDTGTLGASATVGSRVWGCHQKFRVVFGPMGLEDYQRLLPGGDSLSRLVAIVQNYIGEELDWDANLILKKEEVPVLRLGRAGQLGWTTWLYQRRAETDADDLRLPPAEHIRRSKEGRERSGVMAQPQESAAA